MSMLHCFFEIGTDKDLFDGLNISKEKALCETYMGQLPVISLTLKQVTGETYVVAERNLRRQISRTARKYPFLLKSDRLDEQDRLELNKLRTADGMIDDSLAVLSDLLYKHYGRKVIILIDEYDVPLQKAYENGYYDEMLRLIRQLFGYALKTNESLYFSVLTGCMRVSKESIFSDLNNPKLYTLLDDRCDEWFGFTDGEVRQLLDSLGLGEYYETARDWYDGYQVGQSGIYCPWDVINYCDQLLSDSDKTPKNYWANVSENAIVYQFVEMADETTRSDLEALSEGRFVDREDGNQKGRDTIQGAAVFF